MHTPEDLSNEITLMIIECLDIDSLLSFRTTCRKYHSLINLHTRSIIPVVAQNTFPSQTRILQAGSGSLDTAPEATICWLKWLRYHQLAAILVERYNPYSIAAEDPLGDDVRSVMAKGWHVIEHLRLIGEQVARLAPCEIPQRLPSTESTRGGPSPKSEPLVIADMQRALETCHRWMKFMQRLTLAEIQGYLHVMTTLLHGIFGFKVSLEWSLDKIQACESDSAAWVMNRIIELGPRKFWQLFWTSNGAYEPGPKVPARSITSYIEDSWSSHQKPIPPWKLDGARAIERVIDVILRKSYRLLRECYPRGKWKKELHSPMASFRGFPQAAFERVVRSGLGEPQPTKSFESVAVDQMINWEGLEKDLLPPVKRSKGPKRRSRNEVVCRHARREPRRPRVSYEFENLLREWESEWLRTCSLDDF